MSLQAADHSDKPPKLVSPPLCTIRGRDWKAYRNMPDERLPRHIEVLSAFVSHFDRHKSSEMIFSPKEGVKIINHYFPTWQTDRALHEIDTLAAKQISTREGMTLHRLTRANAMQRIELYLR